MDGIKLKTMENISLTDEVMLHSELPLCIAYLLFAYYSLRPFIGKYRFNVIWHERDGAIGLSFLFIALLLMLRSALFLLDICDKELLNSALLAGMVVQIAIPILLFLPYESGASVYRNKIESIIRQYLPIAIFIVNVITHLTPVEYLSGSVGFVIILISILLILVIAGYAFVRWVGGGGEYTLSVRFGRDMVLFTFVLLFTLSVMIVLVLTKAEGRSPLFFIHLLNILNTPIAVYTICRGTIFNEDMGTEALSIFNDADKNDELRERLIKYFENGKPFLKPDLTVNEVARELYSNKTYISRIINDTFNLNFSQFVNKFRVEEAKRLYMENTAVNINKLCYSSGFGSIATFTISFRLFTGLPPAEWCREYRKKAGRSYAEARRRKSPKGLTEE